MTETIVGHERLDVYRLAVEDTAESFRVAQGLAGLQRADESGTGSLTISEPVPLSRTPMNFDGVAETPADYGAEGDYEHRCAEHEHEEKPELADADAGGNASFGAATSLPRPI